MNPSARPTLRSFHRTLCVRSSALPPAACRILASLLLFLSTEAQPRMHSCAASSTTPRAPNGGGAPTHIRRVPLATAVRRAVFGHARMTLPLFSSLLLLLLLPPSALAQGEKTVKILSLMQNVHAPERMKKALNAGFYASMEARSYSVAGGVRVEFIKEETSIDNIAQVIQDAAKNHKDSLLAVLGPMGDLNVKKALPALQEHGLVAFAPITGSSDVRGWNPHLYFLRVDPVMELLALLRFVVMELLVRRVGFMYLQNVRFGDVEYNETVRVLSRMGYALSGVFTVASSLTGSADDAVFDAAWEKFVDTRPQAVIVFGSPLRDTEKFIARMLTDTRTAGVTLLAPSILQGLLVGALDAAAAAGVPFGGNRVVTAGTNPLAKDTEHTAIQRFQREMGAYLATSGKTDYPDPQHFLKNDVDGELMVGGWVAGEVLAQAMSASEWLKDMRAFRASLFNQRRYLVDDLVIGDYGGECTDAAAERGAVCRCNQGGRTVYIKTVLNGSGLKSIVKGESLFPVSMCDVFSVDFRSPLNGVAMFMMDNEAAVRATEWMERGFLAAAGKRNKFDDTHFVRVRGIVSSVATAREDLTTEMRERYVDTVAGVVTEAMLDAPNVTFINPLPLQPRLNRLRRHVIRLSPTVEQQFFVLAEFLGNGSVTDIHAVLRSADAAEMADVLRRSLRTFDRTLVSSALLSDGDELVDRLPPTGDVFVVGLEAADVALVAVHMQRHSGVRVFVVFSEVAMLHEEFVAAFRGTESADRLVFATSLPHWADTSKTSETVKRFHEVVPEEKRTPLSLLGFATTRLLQTVLKQMSSVDSEVLLFVLYRNGVVNVDDMLYGPFRDGEECDDPIEKSIAGCTVNYGATKISVWSMTRALTPTVPWLFRRVTPSMRYVDPDEGKLTVAQLAGIILGSLTAVLLLVGLLLFFLFRLLRRRGARDNHNAPKEPTDPVTLVFTDIESSTALWAVCPEIMPDAVATHHRLIRSLIAKYRCYEVKTIGDSFMIASRSASAAVQLVRDLQQLLLQHDWGTSAIDDSYHAFEEDRAAEDEGYVPPTARLDDAVYRQLWNGVRVRAGLHTGLCSIRHDEVTKGYDYYGGTSNMAARTESVANGGQVLLTRAAYLALSTAEREQLAVTVLGAVALRGVPKPVEMYQLDAVPGRSFAALRLDREVADDDEETESGGHSMSSSTGGETLSAHQSPLAALLTEFFAPVPLQQRWKVLQTMCGRWNVAVPSKGLGTSDTCTEVICRLALKLSRVTTRKAEMRGGRGAAVCPSYGSVGTTESLQLRRARAGLDFAASTPLGRRAWSRTLSAASMKSCSGTITFYPPPKVSFV